MLRAILFDCNGVLVDDEPVHLALTRRILAEEEVALTDEAYYRDLLGLDDRACLRRALGDAGQPVPPERVERLVARKAAYYREHVRSAGLAFFPGALDLVRSAAAGGLTLGIVSGARREEVAGALARGGIADCFKVVVTADDVGEGKPDPTGYRQGLHDLNTLQPLPERLFHPHEVLAVEDSPAGIEAARGAGLVTLGIAHSGPAERLGDAHVVAPSLAGMTLRRLQKLYERASRR